MARLLKVGRLITGSLYDTKTAAGHFATGYRNRRRRFGGTSKPIGSVVVRRVRDKWGVFDRNPKKRTTR